MSKPRLIRAVVFYALVTFVSVAAGKALAQTTINVPADQPTIQAGINAANNGDTVLVAPGTYIENLNFNGKAITVTSSGGATVTIVDGGGTAPVVVFDMNETAGSVLNGLTLQNGLASDSFPFYSQGGGIAIYNASPTITNNVITGNHAVCGIGIEIYGGSAVIRGNTITGNSQVGSGGCGGGGIEIDGAYSQPPATPLITGNTITNNSLPHGGQGGGIAAIYFSSPTIQNNYIAGNAAYNYGGGISLQSYGDPVVVQNLIVNNSAGGGGSGGGISVQRTPSSVANNTIVDNTALDGSSGIYADAYSGVKILISNNIVLAAAGQTAIVCSLNVTTFPVFAHNDVISWSGGQAWSDNCAIFGQSNGNVSLDPLFVDPGFGNYHLQAGSPAIDAGDNSAPNLPQQDYDGHPRILDGNNDCVSTVDMGAYELQGLAANLSFSPSSLSFYSQVIGTTSLAQTATLTNSGAGCFQFAGTQITGDFSQANTCSAAGLPGGSSCAYSVTFTPTASGARTGALTVAGSDGLTRSAPAVSLSGIGLTPPAVVLTPASVNFGNVPVGSTSVQIVTLTNNGLASLTIYSVNVSSPFTASSSCPAFLAGGASCSITVQFSATAAGTQSGALSVSDNAAGSPHSVSLSGTAVDFSLSSPASASVKHGQSIQLKIAVNPLGGPFNSSVALSCSGMPSYAKCSLSPASVTPGATGGSSVLTVSTGAKTPRRTYNIYVTGQSGSLQHTTTIALTVQ